MKNISLYRTALILAGLLTFLALPVTAEEEVHYLPLLGYDFIKLESQTVHAPAIGGIVAAENLTFVALYTRYILTEDLINPYPRGYHSADILLDTDRGRHQFLTLFKSESDQPVYGGLATFQAAAVYGYEVIAGEHLNLALGGGLGVSDFGIDSPLLPVPFVRMAWESHLISAGFDFITGPNLNLTLLPEHQVRLRGDLRMDQFRDARDLIFETALQYRFFAADHPMGDIAGLAVGVKNDTLGFTPGGEDESFELHYYGLFAELDLTLLKLTGGWAFDGRERFGEDGTRALGDGFFLSLQGMYQF